jgi:dTDP-glucose 4,6-dehydratase
MIPKVAVLGANSFSGAAFVEHLRACGDDVVPLARPAHDVNIGLDAILRAVTVERPSHFVNFAALNVVAPSWERWEDYLQTNVMGLARLHDGLRRWGRLAKYVQVSTPEVYGSTAMPVKEDAPLNPSTPYAVSKAAADLFLGVLHSAHGFPVCFTRTVNVYGPGQQPYRIIPKTVLSILQGRKLALHGGGASVRCFLHVRDAAMAIRRVTLHGEPGQVYHAATPHETSIRDLVHKICQLMGAHFDDVVEDGEERLGKDLAYRLDDSKLRALWWSDKIPLEAGLAETVAWFKARAAYFAGHALEYEHRP